MNALSEQEGGSHYKDCAIQPVEYIYANSIGYMEGNVIKYVTRWKNKNGIADLRKARHYIDLLIELEERWQPGEVIQQHDAAAPELDMSDWRNWKAGDLVVVSGENDENLQVGAVARVISVEDGDYEGVCAVQVECNGISCWPSIFGAATPLRWHSRPSAAAQPVAAGDDSDGTEY